MAERRLTAHQKELRKQYSREFANLKKRVKRLERTGYEFDYTFERVEQPTKRDIERIKKLRGKRLQQTGTHVDKWTGEVTEPKAGALKSVRSLTKRKPVKTPFGEEPFEEVPREEAEGTGETPESVGETPEIDTDAPVWENFVVMRAISRAQTFAHYNRGDIRTRGLELVEFFDNMIREHGADKFAKIIYEVMQDNPDVLEDPMFYSDSEFAKSMETLFKAFRNADMIDANEYLKKSRDWEQVRELLENNEDYDE